MLKEKKAEYFDLLREQEKLRQMMAAIEQKKQKLLQEIAKEEQKK